MITNCNIWWLFLRAPRWLWSASGTEQEHKSVEWNLVWPHSIYCLFGGTWHGLALDILVWCVMAYYGTCITSAFVCGSLYDIVLCSTEQEANSDRRAHTVGEGAAWSITSAPARIFSSWSFRVLVNYSLSFESCKSVCCKRFEFEAVFIIYHFQIAQPSIFETFLFSPVVPLHCRLGNKHCSPMESHTVRFWRVPLGVPSWLFSWSKEKLDICYLVISRVEMYQT